MVKLYMPPVPAAGVPLRVAVPLPLSVKLTPPGSFPLSLSVVVVGTPGLVVTVKLPAMPTVKVVLAALVIAGRAWSTVSVKIWVASGVTPLLAVMVKGSSAAGAGRGRAGQGGRAVAVVGEGHPTGQGTDLAQGRRRVGPVAVVTVKVPAVPTMKVVLVGAGDGRRLGSTVSVKLWVALGRDAVGGRDGEGVGATGAGRGRAGQRGRAVAVVDEGHPAGQACRPRSGPPSGKPVVVTVKLPALPP